MKISEQLLCISFQSYLIMKSQTGCSAHFAQPCIYQSQNRMASCSMGIGNFSGDISFITLLNLNTSDILSDKKKTAVLPKNRLIFLPNCKGEPALSISATNHELKGPPDRGWFTVIEFVAPAASGGPTGTRSCDVCPARTLPCSRRRLSSQHS